MNISIVIPNYNGENLLKKNLPFVIDALEEYAEGKKELIIADDSSKDESIEKAKQLLLKRAPRDISWQIIQNTTGKNRGFSSNTNMGVSHATGDVVVLLNTDVKPEKNFLRSLISHFKDSEIFAVGCLDKSIEEGNVVLRGRGLGKWHKGFLVHRAAETNKENTLWVSGGSGAFRKTTWDKLGGLNSIYDPFYWEDIDLSFRAQKIGKKVLFDKNSIVIHEHSSGSIKSHYASQAIKIIAYRNQFFFVWLNITDPNLLLSHILYVPYHIINALKGRDSAFLLGFLQAIKRLREVLAYRQKMKKLFVKSDNDVLTLAKD